MIQVKQVLKKIYQKVSGKGSRSRRFDGFPVTETEARKGNAKMYLYFQFILLYF